MKSPDGDEKRAPHSDLSDPDSFYVLDALID